MLDKARKFLDDAALSCDVNAHDCAEDSGSWLWRDGTAYESGVFTFSPDIIRMQLGEDPAGKEPYCAFIDLGMNAAIASSDGVGDLYVPNAHLVTIAFVLKLRAIA